MSAVLSAIFKGVDEISSVFETMAASGARAVDQWESASSAASNAFEQAAAGAESAAKAMDSAASSADHWTSAVGTYDKAAMEAIYSTEELVELGYKTEDALTAQAKAAEESADALEKSLRVTEDFKATTAELEAELTELQNAYIGTALQYGKNSDEAKALQKEIGELSKVIDQNKKEFADLEKEAGAAGDSMEDSMKAVQSALAAAGIAKLVNEITEAVIEMANEFSDASAVVAKATGATGDALDGLNKSILSLAGCMGNSGNLTEGFTNETNTFNYILTYEAGEYHLHEVNKWKDGGSDALGVTTKCCGNQFWTSFNEAVLYTNKPEYLPENVIICGAK